VYTLGYAASDANIISNKDIPVIRTDRGGQVTYHGPGQLMIYFLLNLKRLKWGPKKLICELEDLLIKFLKNNGIKGERVLGAPGIYVDGKKIASIGLKIKKGFCYHGISLNVDLDLMPFDNIVTCGIDSLEVTQMKNFLDISIDKVKLDLINLLKDQHHKAA
jgi:lipoyl(octanoyl) transferase